MKVSSESKSRDGRISFIRVVATLMIIFTHLIAETDNLKFIAAITTVAVYTFIFISGFIFGKKKIHNPLKWIMKRLSRILIPMYIFMLFLFVMRFILFGEFSISRVLIYMLNLQGILGGVQGGLHLWFLTMIMFCYLITPLLYKIRDFVLCLSLINKTLFFLSIIALQVVISYSVSEKIGLYIAYLGLYIFAYLISTVWDRTLTTGGMFLFTGVVILSMGMRLGVRYFFDGDVIYNTITVPLTQSVIGIYLFVALDKISVLFNTSRCKKIINHLDSISFELYITHYGFIVGPFYLIGITNNMFVDSTLVIAATYISALLLKWTSNKVYETSAFRKSIN